MSKKRKGKGQGTGNSSIRPFAQLNQHQRQGNVLVPPALTIPNLKQTSWLNDRLPDMLWCGLLLAHFEREAVLDLVRQVATLAKGRFESGRDFSLSHTGIANLPGDLGRQIVELVCEDPEPRAELRSLLLLDRLPAKELWSSAIGCAPEPEDWHKLEASVAVMLNHQSQEATDCRWAHVLFKVLGGQMHLRTVDEARELYFYPDQETELSGRIRAMEGAENPFSPPVERNAWSEAFWDQCLRDTKCEAMGIPGAHDQLIAGTTASLVGKTREDLRQHAAATCATTSVDARHKGTFGIAAYSLDLIRELLQIGISSKIIARTGLRALLEAYITLAYLAHRDESDLWLQYRNYGAGQAKLAFLKLDELSDDAMSIDPAVLRFIANEDRWQEFVPINLGHWEKTNLRVMSDQAGVKGEYDRYYPWTSSFTHGNWAAVRNAEYDICANPLHRLHRLLRGEPAVLDDVIPDACRIADLVLNLVDRLYPGFASRISITQT